MIELTTTELPRPENVSVRIGDMSDAERWDQRGIDGNEPITDEMLEWMYPLRPGDQVQVYEPAPLIFDGCVGFISNVRFIEVKVSMWAVNKPRKAITRKAARKMRRKWYV